MKNGHNMMANRWNGIFQALVLLLALLEFSYAAEVDKTGVQSKLSEIESRLQAVDSTLADLQARIVKCQSLGYYRQLRWWQVRLEVAGQERELCVLQKKALQSQQAGQPASAHIEPRIAELQQAAASRELPDADLQRVKAIWQDIQVKLDDIAPQYNWHIVKLNLLRDLVNRSRRIRFYLQEAMRTSEGGYGQGSLSEPEFRRRLTMLMVQGDPETFDIGPIYAAQEDPQYRIKSPCRIGLDELVDRTRRCLTEYGECYYGFREQQLLGQAENAGLLLQRAELLLQDVQELDESREKRTVEVLGFLSHFDRDGSFASLGIPYRSEITIDAKGYPSNLIFGGGARGFGGGAVEREAPFCFDVVDLIFDPYPFFTVSPEGLGVVNSENSQVKGYVAQAAVAVEQGHYIKQPVHLMTHNWSRATSPQFLPEERQANENLLLTNADGDTGRYPNIWHPAIRETARKNLSALARFCKTIPNFLFYDKLTWEPAGLIVSGKSGSSLEAGYSAEAIAAFREHLKEKFETIGRLNHLWRSDYSNFGAIEPPPDPYVARRRRATPLSYEFELFRAESYGDYLALAVEALKSEDPDHPVAAEIHSVNAHFAPGSALAFQLMQRLPVEFIEDHYNNWSGSYTSLNMLYSLCLYAGKIPVQSEYIWTYPRLLSPHSENDFRVTGELSIWRNMVWGRKILNVFGAFDGWGYRFNYMDEAHSCELAENIGPSGILVREAGSAILLGKKRARDFWPWLARTEVVKPKIAIIVPATSMINEYPYYSPGKAYSTSNSELIRFERFLTPRDFDFRFVPEEVIVSGQEDLTGFKAIILPYAPCFPSGLADKLLAWIDTGGTLVASGIPGIYDPYGFDSPLLMNRVFGSQLSYTYTGDDELWRWKISCEKNGGPVVKSIITETDSLLVSAGHGQGRVWVSGESYFGSPYHRILQVRLADILEQAIGWPTASSRRMSFEMVARQDASGQRYLFVINPDLRDTATDYVTVDGHYRSIIDLGIGSHCAIALAPRQAMTVNSRYADATTRHSDGTMLMSAGSLPGRTTFQLRLEPGEGTVLKLGI
jgi:hypothetical protein